MTVEKLIVEKKHHKDIEESVNAIKMKAKPMSAPEAPIKIFKADSDSNESENEEDDDE